MDQFIADEAGQFSSAATPATLKDLNGKDVVETGIGYQWTYRNFVDSPDPRYRQIVKWFTEAGYTEFEKDEFALRKE